MTRRVGFITAFSLAAAVAPAGVAHAAGGGGTSYTPLPVITGIKCTKLCAGKARVQGNGEIRITGKRLQGVRSVVFHGSERTKRDNVVVKVAPPKGNALRVRVPMSAGSGPVSVWKSATAGSQPSKPIAVLPPPPPERSAKLSPASGPRQPGAPRIETGISATKVFFAGTKVRFSYRLNGREPVPVTIELVHLEDGLVVRTWHVDDVEPEVVHTIKWNGQPQRGLRASAGRYVFRLTAGSDGAIAQSSRQTNAQRDAFDFYGHKFPIRGRHDYGQSGARFGAGRGGRSHQGQDVFAKCGTKMVAARAGTVKYNQYHAAAGYYLVIDGYKSDYDYVYMHLEERSPFRAGDKVRTGQMIGRVGDTGNAHGCHLHYEMWGAPGWYRGGSPIDPYAYLKAWDRWS